MVIAHKGSKITRVQRPYMTVAAQSAEDAVARCPEWKHQTLAGLVASAVDCVEMQPGYWTVSIAYAEPEANRYAWLRML